MFKIIKAGILGIFSAYWLATAFFTLPDNHLNLSLFEESQSFQLFFFQKWGFFAPPPNSNERTYYTFLKKDEKEHKTFEIVEPITKKKKEDAPFNWKANTIDYVISNSINGINEILYDAQQMRDYEITNVDTSKIEKNYDQFAKNIVQDSPQFQTLVKYAEIVAAKNGINRNDYDLTILITKKEIPKFYKRFEENNNSEIILFQSDTIHLAENSLAISMR